MEALEAALGREVHGHIHSVFCGRVVYQPGNEHVYFTQHEVEQVYEGLGQRYEGREALRRWAIRKVALGRMTDWPGCDFDYLFENIPEPAGQ